MRWKRTVPGGAIMLLALLAVAAPAPVAAGVGSIGPEPAATLLLPYFVVDFQDMNGPTTIFTVHNASAEPALVHVTLWTDWAYPTLAFDMYLTGYDLQAIDLRQVFVDGILPITADEQADPEDEISPTGPLSIDASFPACDGVFPFPSPILTDYYFDRIRNGHTGQIVEGLGACVGRDLGDGIARGYITIDNMNQCALAFPNQSNYFQDAGTGAASNKNQLWGDWFIIDPVNNFAQGDNLVHIEANDDLNATDFPLRDFGDPQNSIPPMTVNTVANATGYTFYGRYLQPPGNDGQDNREPLGIAWGTRYFNAGAFDSTTLSVWRDPTSNDVSFGSWDCGLSADDGPSWYPLNETQVVAFDLQEDAVELCGPQFGPPVTPPLEFDPTCFPAATGRYEFGEGDLEVPFDAGWLYLNLNLGIDTSVGDTDYGTNGTLSQSWVSSSHRFLDRYSVDLPAIELSSALQDQDPFVEPPTP